MNKDECYPCRKCKGQPHLKRITDLYYMQCDCGKWDTYEFCGATKKGAISSWNESNGPKRLNCIRERYGE